MLIDNYTIINLREFKDCKQDFFYKRIFKDNGANLFCTCLGVNVS